MSEAPTISNGDSTISPQVANFPAANTSAKAVIITEGSVHLDQPFGYPKEPSSSQSSSELAEAPLSKFPRISRPVELLRPSYDVVVVGSGYGGGVAASRMARGGQSVCLLELGKERWPGEFPTSIAETARELHVSGELAPNDTKGASTVGGDPTGLYHLVMGHGQNAFVGNGLGGTSLLNANVFLEADPGVLDLKMWPAELRGQDKWAKYYDRASEVLEPESYPLNYPRLPKLDLLQKQAELMGLGNNFRRVPQTTCFTDGPNKTGVQMKASTLSGMDTTGLNDGSKSTTLVNYLSDAWNWGAEMFCQCEVRYVKKAPSGEGYIVYFAWHGNKRGAFKDNIYDDLMWVHAKKCVFLGAGSLGSTEILLRSKEVGLPLSDRIGTGMSGNGDILAFGYNTDYEVNSLGKPNPSTESPIGPCITGVIDCREQKNPFDGFVIEEGVVPKALAPFFQAMLELLPGRVSPQHLTAYQKVTHLLARQGSRILGPYFPKGSTEKTQTYLIMSHDSNQAILSLKNDKPVLKFLGVGRSDHVKKLNGILAKATNAIGGTLVGSPFFAALGEQEITVHAIGGVCMSSDNTGENGAANHMGEVFQGDGPEVHHGLVVCDGALIPGSLGVNPFATITALAERSVEAIAKKNDIEIDYKTKNGLLDLFGKPAHLYPHKSSVKAVEDLIDLSNTSQTSGVGFTEVMSGYINIGDNVKDFTIATKIAKGRCGAARFFLSVKSWNTHDLVMNSAHSANLTGSFSCAGLNGPFMVLGGEFQLFSEDPRTASTQNLTYKFDMINPEGEKLHFYGYKIVDPSVAFDPIRFWKATSTLYVTITKQAGEVIGRGTLRIPILDFASEMATLQPTGPSLLKRLGSTANLLRYFTLQSAKVFFAPISYLQWPGATYSGYISPTSISETIQVTASDGVSSTLHMWNPLSSPTPEDAGTILFIPGASVDHQIFALPTIEKNAVDYFREKGYCTYSVTHRVGRCITARQKFTTFDARLDIQAALKSIREAHVAKTRGQPKKIYIIAHCAGSVALAAGLLDGTIPGDWIQGITASNVFMHPIFSRLNLAKASLPISPDKVYNLVAGPYFNCISNKNDSIIQRILNQALRFYPSGTNTEICNSVVCHRSSLIFGRLWTHRNLNAATHAQLDNFIGGTSMTTLGHLMSMGRLGYVHNNDAASTSLVTPENIAKLKGIPIFFMSGSDNAVYTPESTDKSYTTLINQFGSEDYERKIFADRGHLDCWMGATAYLDVYPRVQKHLENTFKKSL